MNLADNAPHFVTVTRTASGAYTWLVDGVTDTTATTSAYNVNSGFSPIVGAQRTTGSPANFLNGRVGFVALFRRAISFQEHIELRDNPWQLFEPQRIWVPVSAGGGPNTYNVSLSETASTTDGVVSALVGASNLTESAATSDSASSVLAAIAAVVEAASAVDAQSATTTRSGLVTEAASVSDAVSAVLTRVAALTETASLTDLQTAVALALAAVSEAATASDQVSTGPVVSASLTEAASPVDALTCAALLVGAVAESITATDVVARTAQLVALLTESATATDTVSGVAPTVYNVSITELAAALDVVSAILSGDSLEHVYLVSRIVQQVLATSLLARQVSLVSPIEQDIDSQSNI